MRKQLALLILAVFSGLAQIKQGEESLFLRKDPLTGIPTSPLMVPAMDGPVNPDHYRVGPSDVLVVDIGGIGLQIIPLSVTPEGVVLIPTVGIVEVGGKSLSDVKKLIVSAVGKKYFGRNHTVSLVAPHVVRVSVAGNVRTIWPAELKSTQRAGDAVTLATDITEASLEKLRASGEMVPMPPPSSRRNIVVRHVDGTTARVDLDKFNATHDDSVNPYLRGGDVIIVPPMLRNLLHVSVYGGVRVPARFEFVAGESISDLVTLGLGLTSGARGDSATMTRYSPDGRTLVDTLINVDAILKGNAKDIVLLPGDRLVIPEVRGDREDFHVTIEGEVRYPGIYPISPEVTKLSEILRRAGGFTLAASAKLATVIRKPRISMNRDFERLAGMKGVTSFHDTSSIQVEQELRLQGELVFSDFSLLLRGDTTLDVALQPDDVISVPRSTNSVFVFGQVARPSHVALVPRKDVEYYIDRAGGSTERGRLNDVVIIKGATRQWLNPSETEVEEGDFIWVPRTRERSFEDQLAIIGQVASVFSVAISLILLTAR